MKKLIMCIFMTFLSINSVYASDEFIVTLDKCVDGDTAWFYYNNEEIKARFLAIDTPESTTTIEAYGKEASIYTCNELSSASKIELEYDDNSDKEDKYNRQLVWVFVDDELLQNKIVSQGLAEVKYLYGDYKYTSILQDSLVDAKNNKLGMWSDEVNTNYETYIYIGIVIVIVILYIFSSKYRNEINKKTKRKIKNKINKEIENKIDDLL